MYDTLAAMLCVRLHTCQDKMTLATQKEAQTSYSLVVDSV